MEIQEIRLRLIEVMLPVCSRFDATDPCELIKKLSKLEEYVTRPEIVSKSAKQKGLAASPPL